MVPEGMERDRGFDGKGGLWAGMRITDMRAKYDLHPGCMVTCEGRPNLGEGILLRFDADRRLAKIHWTGGYEGWWYVKDLIISRKAPEPAKKTPLDSVKQNCPVDPIQVDIVEKVMQMELL